MLVVSDGNGFKTSTMRLGADVIVFTQTKRTGISPLHSFGNLIFRITLEQTFHDVTLVFGSIRYSKEVTVEILIMHE